MKTTTPPLLSSTPLYHHDSNHRILLIAWQLLKHGKEDQFRHESFIDLCNFSFINEENIAEALTHLMLSGGISEMRYYCLPYAQSSIKHTKKHMDYETLLDLNIKEKSVQPNLWEIFVKKDHTTFYDIKINREELLIYIAKYIQLWKENRFITQGKNTTPANIQLLAVLKEMFFIKATAKPPYFLTIDETLGIDTFAVLLFLEMQGAIKIQGFTQSADRKITTRFLFRRGFAKYTSLHEGKIYHGFPIESSGQGRIRLISPFKLMYKGKTRTQYKGKATTTLLQNTLAHATLSIDIETFLEKTKIHKLNLRKNIDKFQHGLKESFGIDDYLIKVSQTKITLNKKYWDF